MITKPESDLIEFAGGPCDGHRLPLEVVMHQMVPAALLVIPVSPHVLEQITGGAMAPGASRRVSTWAVYELALRRGRWCYRFLMSIGPQELDPAAWDS